MSWVIFSLLAAILYSIHRVIQKRVLKNEHAFEYLTVYNILRFILVIPLLFFVDLNLSLKSIILIYLATFLGSVAWLFIVKSSRHLELSIVEPLRNIKPIFVLILAFLILNEQITKMQFFGIILIIFGAYTLELKNIKHFLEPVKLLKTRYHTFMILAAISASVATIIEKYLIKDIPILSIIFLAYLFHAVNYSTVQVVFYKGIRDIKHGLKVGGFVILIGVISALIGDLFYFSSIKIQEVSLVFPLLSLSTVITTLVGGEILHERNLFHKSISCFIMIFGAYLIVA